MSGYDGAGNWDASFTPTTDRDNGIYILASKFDQLFTDLKNSFENVLTLDAQTTPTASIGWGGYKITNLGSGAARIDAANLGQVQDGIVQYAVTSGTAPSYTATLSPAITSYTTGSRFLVKFHEASAGDDTIDFNSIGAAKTIKLYGNNLEADDIPANAWAILVYDGTNMNLLPISTQTNSDQSTALPTGYLTGLIISNNSTDANNDLDIAVGKARDQADSINIVLSTALTKQKDADWASGDDAGGMPATVTKTGTFTSSGTAVTGALTSFDTEFEIGDVLYSTSNSEGRRITAIGSSTSITLESAYTADVSTAEDVKKNGEAPNCTYSVIALSNSDGSSVDIGFDTQTDAVNLLADSAVSSASLTRCRRIGYIMTDSSGNIKAFEQLGDEFYWDSSIQDVTFTSAGATTRLSIDVTAPPYTKVIGNMVYYAVDGNVYGLITSLDRTDVAPTSSLTSIRGISPEGEQHGASKELNVHTNNLSQIGVRFNLSNAVYSINTAGFVDIRKD